MGLKLLLGPPVLTLTQEAPALAGAPMRGPQEGRPEAAPGIRGRWVNKSKQDGNIPAKG